MRWRWTLAVALAGAAAANPPGTRDLDFGLGDGRLRLNLRGNLLDQSQALCLLRLPDGRYLAGGAARNGAEAFASGFLERRLSNGVIDAAFGNGGVRFSQAMTEVRALARQADGRIVVAGTFGPVGAQDTVLERYSAGGTLDSDFGDGGIRLLPDLGHDSVQALAIDSAGRIVYAGLAGGSARVGRLTSAGQPDPGFNGGQERMLSLPASQLSAWALALDPDDAIVVAGDSLRGGEQRIVAARVRADGTLDPAFGQAANPGLSEYNLTSGAESVRALARRADGRYWLAGGVYTPSEDASDFLLARFTSGGVLDPSIGDNSGWVRAGFPAGGADTALALALDASGRPLVSGTAQAAPDANRIGLVRFAAIDGAIDSGFGNSGRLLVDAATTPLENAAIALEPDGRVVLAGTAAGVLGSYAMLARTTASGSLDHGFRSHPGFAYQPLAGAPASNARAVHRLADGRLLVAAVAPGAQATDPQRVVLARYTSAGALDSSFGGGDGSVELPPSTSVGASPYAQMLVQTDGAILVVAGADEADIVVHRVSAAGAIDMGYGSGGSARIDLGGNEITYAAALTADDRLLAVGLQDPNPRGFVARLSTAGTLDPSFAATGATPGVRYDPVPGLLAPTRVAVQPDGRLLFAHGRLLARLSADGVIENGFGSGGTADFGSEASIADILPLADGRILLAGTHSPAGNDNWRVMRLLPGGAADADFGGSGRVDFDTGSSRDSLQAIAVQRNGRILLAGELARQAAFGRLAPNGEFDIHFGAGSGRVLAGMPFPLHDVTAAGARIVGAGPPLLEALLAHATLTRLHADIAVEVQVSGSGNVVSSNGFIQCGSTCSNDFAPGESVVLQAQPAAGSTFLGWSGACAGQGPLCQFTMPATPLSAVAQFAPNLVFRDGFE